MTLITSAMLAKLIAPVAGTAFREVARSAGSAFAARNKVGLPSRSRVAELTDFVEQQLKRHSHDGISDAVSSYVASPECITLIEHLLIFRALGRPISEDGPLRRELAAGADRYDLLSLEDQDALFRILLGAADAVLTYAGVTGDEGLRQQPTESSTLISEAYLQSIDTQVALLTRPLRVTISEVDSALRKYAASLRSISGKLQPPNFDGTESVPLDRLFVVPRLKQVNRIEGRELDLEDLITERRVVVLGDPGGGKTTLTKKLSQDLVKGSIPTANPTVPHETIFPFVVVLREFGAFLARSSGSVAEFISETLRVTYQVTLTSDSIEYILSVGRAYVIFDGLDELLDPSDRQRVADIVTAFGVLYSSTGILVTSRRVGYLQAPLPADDFTIVSLDGFEAAQVEAYVRNWFSLLPGLPDERRAEMVRQFIEDSRAVPDLCSSPLMLALICTIYRFEGYIPRNRPDVYEKCTKMLFDRWDRHRGLREQFEFEAHVEPALMSLAHRIYLDSDLQSGVTERGLVSAAADYLDEWQYGDRVLAERAAEQFVRFCRGRAWVFSDVGLTPDGESLYAFTHRTFLEYFTAAHLARTVTSTDELLSTLLEKIRMNEWDVVAQLALQIRAKSRQGGPDVVATSLLESAELCSEEEEKRNILAFISRCLGFLPLSPRCARGFGSTLIELALGLEIQEKAPQTGSRSRILSEALKGIVESALEARVALGESAAQFLLGRLESLIGERPEVQDPNPAHEITVSAAWSLGRRCASLQATSEIGTRLAAAVGDQLAANYRSWGKWAAVALYWGGQLSPLEVVDAIPPQSWRFSSPQAGLNISLVQPVYSALADVLSEEKNIAKEEFAKATSLVHEYAQRAAEAIPLSGADFGADTTPLQSLLESTFLRRNQDENAPVLQNPLSGQNILDSGLLLATFFERQEDAEVVDSLTPLLGRLRQLEPILRARAQGGGGHRAAAEAVIPAGKHRDLLLSWAAGEVDFLLPLASATDG
ncbi:NACHT domain-containing protein [Pseudonocardia sp. DSM 110487]|uniref:NACHT domain-containing protein n=1 Tax=Pseudonocardia sp. DSM 110487 TaxID=2865833 RepID=UPI001C69E6D6|nr:NACHT domain-containing protein [Pseudonocardia sp. DSM 110487]QYN33003.1 NACHT domain-containing protein [Pseudonocardia sp. DSM 110487]